MVHCVLIATFQTRVEHHHSGQIAEIEGAPDAQTIAVERGTDRHPFVVGARRIEQSRFPRSLGFRLVILGAAAPTVVGRFVVVPYRDPRVLAVQFLQVRIAAIEGVAEAIVGQRQQLVARAELIDARLGDGLSDAVAADREPRRLVAGRTVLVDVIAEVQHRVEVIAARCFAIDVEETLGMVRAGEEGQRDVGDISHR
jgi:hypothetical protein